MVEAVYILCGLTSLACTVLLLRGYRRTRTRLLLWSGLCFVALAVSNVILFVDLVLFPGRDLSVWRSASALVGIGTLLYGLIWDSA
ncbi:DUF5985 family protein [Stigmatella aurantiaca]|uniref:Conserved uncharacterized protein n=1 Tax=Stigmatella aurantiaca (strain DW4/3-1) TaxID=378806 RepID=Q08ZF3_STIAD|nr:DUF5985 family protein [Stigmatella aurantiaca]ADO75325.1 conserved uncharacterized protein [Stigmatella aurantiaca DW4/3-1]EAU65845.1 hypothetical protein STIAU_5689 [Stigmatella aurantiaca DW4/3-1]